MSAGPRRRLVVSALPARDEEIGRWLWALEDTRARTRAAVAGLGQSALDTPGPGGNTVGTLLYHLAGVEADWLFVDVLGTGVPTDLAPQLPWEDRNSSGRLVPVHGLPLDQHLRRLDSVRTHVIEAFSGMDAERFHRRRELRGHSVTPAWVLHHLCQHEAEHRGQIMALRDSLAAS